ncbi:uncharacterized protein BO97DRAFT_476956 [Aspergillus homomorphus CBS 101889]|uniref:Uncharacterized protein n=1 Tax=Aspergillus homomorphus (strain CBS 101889) TaxID=1450537 RepID=A0A395I291_ASPHC|nr:hypothetical protein BO97DRAFT_476956 [Aspergillus homomorphus CBS 101889]RAL13799.1 hypothetical protein BO97DRAFT_476956 [Aspergillus homomorphus CBS 101889]
MGFPKTRGPDSVVMVRDKLVVRQGKVCDPWSRTRAQSSEILGNRMASLVLRTKAWVGILFPPRSTFRRRFSPSAHIIGSSTLCTYSFRGTFNLSRVRFEVGLDGGMEGEERGLRGGRQEKGKSLPGQIKKWANEKRPSRAVAESGRPSVLHPSIHFDISPSLVGWEGRGVDAGLSTGGGVDGGGHWRSTEYGVDHVFPVGPGTVPITAQGLDEHSDRGQAFESAKGSQPVVASPAMYEGSDVEVIAPFVLSSDIPHARNWAQFKDSFNSDLGLSLSSLPLPTHIEKRRQWAFHSSQLAPMVSGSLFSLFIPPVDTKFIACDVFELRTSSLGQLLT